MPQVKPTLPQWQYITSEARFPAFIAGFGAGKTEAAILRAVFGLINNPGTNRGFYAPTYDLIRMIAWPRFEAMLESLQVHLLPHHGQPPPDRRLRARGRRYRRARHPEAGRCCLCLAPDHGPESSE